MVGARGGHAPTNLPTLVLRSGFGASPFGLWLDPCVGTPRGCDLVLRAVGWSGASLSEGYEETEGQQLQVRFEAHV